MKPLLINNSLFWQYKGQTLSSWYLCGDNTSDEMRDAHIAWCLDHGCDGIILCLNNEECMSLFRDEYMRTLDMVKYATLIHYLDNLRAMDAKIVFAFYDGPSPEHPKYPCLKYMDRHEAFIQAACQTLNKYAAAYLIGCESSRYWNPAIVGEAIRVTKKYSGLIPVSTHMQWKPNDYSWPGGDFCCYEHSWHPKDGDKHSVEDCVKEVLYIQSHLPPKFPIWCCEWNLNSGGSKSMAQAKAMGELPGIVGVGGPL